MKRQPDSTLLCHDEKEIRTLSVFTLVFTKYLSVFDCRECRSTLTMLDCNQVSDQERSFVK